MNILINIKSGTGGYYNYDGCDLCLREIKNEYFQYDIFSIIKK